MKMFATVLLHGVGFGVISRVTNSIEFRPGMPLSRRQVELLIEDGWTVTVLSKG
jgi:hypothetical protein